MGVTTPHQIRIERLLDEEKIVQGKWAELTETVNTRDDKTMLDAENDQVVMYRERIQAIRSECEQLTDDLAADKEAEKKSLATRKLLAGLEDGAVQQTEDGILYRDFASYARDMILSKETTICSRIAQEAGGQSEVLKARERLELLKRTPANTLSSNVAGLNPPDHIAQIFQIIDKSRPLVAAAPSTGLIRGTITYPSVDTRPVVAVQASEKTEAGNTGMVVSMKTSPAVTYLGGGDLSWQAINWSTPDALQLWFDLVAADYALKTETAAADKVIDDGFTHVISDVFTMGTSDFTAFLKAVGEGYAKVYSISHRIADTILLAPDVYGYLIGLTSTPQPIFISVNGQNIGPLNVIVSRGLDSGTAIVCDLDGLLVAETPGAPVELRVVEPAIGGLEVGLIGAFQAVVVDPGSFSLISAAS